MNANVSSAIAMSAATEAGTSRPMPTYACPHCDRAFNHRCSRNRHVKRGVCQKEKADNSMEQLSDLAQALSDNPVFESCDTPDTDCQVSVHKTRRRKSRKTESSGQGRRRVTSDWSFSSGEDLTRSHPRSHRPRCLHSDSDESHADMTRVSARQHWLTRTTSAQLENRMDNRHASEHTVRRRRRQCRMSVDGCPPSTVVMAKEICAVANGTKRKRRRSLANYHSQSGSCPSVRNDDMEYSDPSSYLSSDENRGFVTNDEGREGDDEQSDFFHEPGATSSSFGMLTMMESDCDKDEVKNPRLYRLFDHCLVAMSERWRENHPPKMARVFKHRGRQFRQGCRRIDSQFRDLSDDSSHSRPMCLGVVGAEVNSDTGGEKKRRKRGDQRYFHHESR